MLGRASAIVASLAWARLVRRWNLILQISQQLLDISPGCIDATIAEITTWAGDTSSISLHSLQWLIVSGGAWKGILSRGEAETASLASIAHFAHMHRLRDWSHRLVHTVKARIAVSIWLDEAVLRAETTTVASRAISYVGQFVTGTECADRARKRELLTHGAVVALGAWHRLIGLLRAVESGGTAATV
jgi:hypothetical protein